MLVTAAIRSSACTTPHRLALRDPIADKAPGIVPGFLKPDETGVRHRDQVLGCGVDLDPDVHLAAACRIAGRQLSPRVGEEPSVADLGWPARATCPTTP